MEIKLKKFKAFILAGGKSSRMGFDKALIKHHEGGNWLTHKIKILNTLNLETFVITNHTSHSKEVDNVDPKTQAIRIARTVGDKKREVIVKKADELGIRVFNRRDL